MHGAGSVCTVEPAEATQFCAPNRDAQPLTAMLSGGGSQCESLSVSGRTGDLAHSTLKCRLRILELFVAPRFRFPSYLQAEQPRASATACRGLRARTAGAGHLLNPRPRPASCGRGFFRLVVCPPQERDPHLLCGCVASHLTTPGRLAASAARRFLMLATPEQNRPEYCPECFMVVRQLTLADAAKAGIGRLLDGVCTNCDYRAPSPGQRDTSPTGTSRLP